MKTKLLIIILLGFTSLSFAQNEETAPKEHAQEALQNLMASFLGGQSKAQEATIPDQINFMYSIKMDSWEEGSNDINKIDFFWNDTQDYLGMNVQGNLMVSDISQEVLINYNLENRTASILPNFLKSLSSLAAKKVDFEILDVKSLGNFKTILGYNCEEFYIDSNKETAKVWINREIGFDIQKIMKTLIGTNDFDFLNTDKFKELENATILESASTNKESGKINYIKITEVGGKTSIDNSEYEITRGIGLE